MLVWVFIIVFEIVVNKEFNWIFSIVVLFVMIVELVVKCLNFGVLNMIW